MTTYKSILNITHTRQLYLTFALNAVDHNYTAQNNLSERTHNSGRLGYALLSRNQWPM